MLIVMYEPADVAGQNIVSSHNDIVNFLIRLRFSQKRYEFEKTYNWESQTEVAHNDIDIVNCLKLISLSLSKVAVAVFSTLFALCIVHSPYPLCSRNRPGRLAQVCTTIVVFSILFLYLLSNFAVVAVKGQVCSFQYPLCTMHYA